MQSLRSATDNAETSSLARSLAVLEREPGKDLALVVPVAQTCVCDFVATYRATHDGQKVAIDASPRVRRDFIQEDARHVDG
ncbi:hypothetical protein [Rhizobium phaseoli]|uniref:hypothetical protein n=1 Tax=Rhizobium phaseoli TaxID=396 RepID=UPI000BE94159|nr:hypothetical protein [Rhizobium phaseoli]PDS28016.1 hypothetical protein CO650_28665 [Rhizobium phaseoli]